MMSESLSCRHSETSSWDRPFKQGQPSGISHLRAEAPDGPAPALSQGWTVGTAATAEADKSSPHLTDRYSRPQLEGQDCE